jgi:ABC-type glycerol-3-phosphate transport system permease component
MKLNVGHKTKFAIRLVFLLIFLVWTIFPFFWMISMSLKEKTDILAMPPKWEVVKVCGHRIRRVVFFERFPRHHPQKEHYQGRQSRLFHSSW